MATANIEPALSTEEWTELFTSLGIPLANATTYAIKFHEEDARKSHLPHMSNEELTTTYNVNKGGHRHMIKLYKHTSSPSPSTDNNNTKIQHQAPQLKPKMTPSEFRLFRSHWEVFKGLVRLTGDRNITASIFSLCCKDHPDVRTSIANQNSNYLELIECDFLKMVEDMVTERSNPDTYRSKFFALTQNRGESCQQWLDRLQACVPDCEFEVKCEFDTSDPPKVHNIEKMFIRTKFITGMYNEFIKQDLLTKSKSLKTLSDVVNHAMTMEAAAKDMAFYAQNVAHIQQASPGRGQQPDFDYQDDYYPENDYYPDEVGRLSSYQRSKRPQHPQWNQNRSRPPTGQPADPCGHCGRANHGRGQRAQKCPAFKKNCGKCGKEGHFAVVCRSKPKQSPTTTESASAIIAHIPPTESVNSTHQDCEIEASITPQWNEVGRQITLKIFPDTGASLSIAGPQHLKAMQIPTKMLNKTEKQIKAVGGTELHCLGWVPTVFKVGTRTSQQNLYICENIDRVYFSKSGCRDVNIIHDSFPKPLPGKFKLPPPSDTPKEKLHLVETVDAVPQGNNIPVKPTTIPYAPIPENIPLLKQYLIDSFAHTTFNNDKSRPFPKMTGVPKAHIYLKPDDKPFTRTTPNHIPGYWLKAVDQLLDTNTDRDIIEPAPLGLPTRWCSGMVVTPKKAQLPTPNLRMTVDYQQLNKQCIREIHHVQPPFQLVSQIPRDTYKTVLDAVDSYQAVELDEESRALTTFITHRGLYRYKRVPAGLHDAGGKYTSRYDFVIQRIPRKVKCVDDTCLWDTSIEEAFFHTWDYLAICAKHGIVLNVSKFEFCKKEVTFAGFQLTPDGIKPAKATLEAIRNFPTPKNVTDMRSWFGLVRQVAYAHSCSEDLAPFRDLLKSKEKNKFYWSEDLQNLFDRSKDRIINAVVDGIASFDFQRQTYLQCDWSKQGLGFLLLQKYCSCPTDQPPNCCLDGWKLVLAGSRFTNEAESRYAPTEGEALAVAWALNKAQMFVLGCPTLTVVTDHQPLLGIFNDRDIGTIKNPRIRRLKEKTLDFSFKIMHCPGKFHIGADALSRNPTSPATCAFIECDNAHHDDTLFPGTYSETTVLSKEMEDDVLTGTIYAINTINQSSTGTCDTIFPEVITLDRLRVACQTDPVYTQLQQLVQKGFPDKRNDTPPLLKMYWQLDREGQLSALENIVLKEDRLVIPKSLRTETLRILHSAHQGCTGMTARATASIYWPSLRKDIMSFQTNCNTCIENAPSQPNEPLQTRPLPERPFQHISSDLFELNSHHYLIIVDRFSGFLHIFHSKDQPTHMFLEKCFREIFIRYV